MFDISIYPQDGPGSLVSKSLAYSSILPWRAPNEEGQIRSLSPLRKKLGKKFKKLNLMQQRTKKQMLPWCFPNGTRSAAY